MSIPELLLGAPPYVALMASLPALPHVLAAKRLPISRLRLERRLQGLAPGDKALLDDLQVVFSLTRRDPARDPALSDAMLVHRVRAFMPRLPSAALERAVDYTMALSTITAALRRRQRGEPAPAADVAWGYGRWTRTIHRHWQEPELGVGRAFPWVREAAGHIESGDAIALESLLMREFWTMTGRLRLGHDFDFTAVALYVLRYQVLERRVAYDAEAATMRFRTLVEAGLADFSRGLEAA
jgi:hypothetical protein